MNVVITAREKSSRYPRKHLHPINHVPMLWGIIKRLQGIGARVILSTSKREDNRSYCIVAGQAGAEVYCEEAAPEWDLVSRNLGMAKAKHIEHWVSYSGDCPFTDLRAIKLAWEHVSKDQCEKVCLVTAASSKAVGMGDRITSGDTLRYWTILGNNIPPDDKRREQAWVYVEPSEYREISVELPWEDRSQTPIKTSIDWPMEGAVADLIVRHLGRWPETDDDILKVYREIKELNPEVNNTPPNLDIYDGRVERRDRYGNPIVDGQEDLVREGK